MTRPAAEHAAEEALARGERCVLALRGSRWPVVTPTVFWADGAGVWMTAAARSAEVAALRRDPRCALWIDPPGDGTGAASRPGAVVSGRARVFSATDPLGLALHGPTISAAMTALVVKQARAVLGYAQDAARAMPRLVLRQRVVVRVAIEQLRAVARPAAPPGMAPALPVVVPADVRRALAGERRVVIATQGGTGIQMTPATWGAGFALNALPDGWDAGPAAVAVDAPPRWRPTEAVGLVLVGTLATTGLLEPVEATWWRGFEAASAPVPSTAGVTLPD